MTDQSSAGALLDSASASVSTPLNVEDAVRERYSAAAQAREVSLCCPVTYDRRYLEMIPDEIIERDYGCGDPSQWVEVGDTVLDLGSGGGKICYIAAQVVGSSGRVIGVDMNDEMLALARKYQPAIAEKLGYTNVEFHKGRIQDLQLSLDQFDEYLRERPIAGIADWIEAQSEAQRRRDSSPMIASESIDVIVSNCVLNLVRPAHRRQLFDEMHRVLKRGGRAVISDIVSDEPVPESLQNDPELWSGCLSGAFLEEEFIRAFEDAGFYGIEIVSRQADPWAVVAGIEFRSVTLRAWKGKDGPCLERKQAVIYRGPWQSVTDDDGHRLVRGQRVAVCDKTFQIYSQPPYADQMIPLEPADSVAIQSAAPFDCAEGTLRNPQETKSKAAFSLNVLPTDDCCSPGGACC